MRSALPFVVSVAVFSLFAGCAKAPGETPGTDTERGRLLYDTACVACHTTQAHWREKKIVKDWPGLLAQVTRWQAVAGQHWSQAEIRDVAAYLNQRFYKLPSPPRT